jgi:hypothetical protein
MSFIAGTRITGGTGGTISSITGYTVHTFSTPGAATFVPSGNGTIEVLVVGAGGATPGSQNAGGGGAVVYNKLVNVTSGTPYPITVGLTGTPTGGFSSCTFNNATIIAYGGGAFGNYTTGYSSPNASGAAAGNGGGDGGIGAGVTGLGFPGGFQAPGGYGQPAGGGGAGGVGSNGYPGGPGNGGIGVSYSITGVSSYYGAGGGRIGSPNGGLPGASYGTGNGTPGAVIIRYPS